MGYYWVGVRAYVNGEEVDEAAYVEVYPNDNIVIQGYLYKDVNPVSGVKIDCNTVIGGIRCGSTYTDSNGFFRLSFRAPDWDRYYLCNVRARCFYILARVPDDYPPSWEFRCTCACRKATIVISTEPSGVEVYVDGAYKGVT